MAQFLDLFALEMSLHGWLALGLGCIGVIACNWGLMALVRRDRHRETYSAEDLQVAIAAERRRRASLEQGGPEQGGPEQGGLEQGGLEQGGLEQGQNRAGPGQEGPHR